jgi:GAF domain-containing protein
VIKASQAVSTEIVLDQLIETLMRIALEHAGAQRGLLVLIQGDTTHIEAMATTDQKSVMIAVRQEAVRPAAVPESLLNTVIRTRQSVILDDAWAQNPFSADPYILERRARSVLCLPLLKQTRLIGVLYLENNLASHVFTPEYHCWSCWRRRPRPRWKTPAFMAS